MFNPRSRKAFTVVELVIVIAVIAILAAVLIPTFSGIVKKAHVSNDIQTATNMTMQLRTQDHDIRTEVELKQAMDAAYGVDYFPALAPKSADQGYHFWFEIVTQTVVLSKIDDLTPNNGATGAVYDLENVTMDETPGGGARVGSAVENFAPGAPRTNIVNGYYLMDRTGSKFAEIITAAETTTSNFNDIENETLKATLNSIGFINETGVVGSLEGVTTLYFSPFVSVIGGNGLNSNNITNITIPANVKVGPAALNGVNGNEAANPNVYVDVETVADLLNIFLAGDTYKTELFVTISNGEVYQVINNSVYPIVNGSVDTNTSVGDLVFANNVRSFSVRADSPAVEASGKYYVACDVSTLGLTAEDFIGEREGAPSSTTVIWTSSNTNVATINESTGEVSVKLPAIGGSSETTIRATATAGGHYEELILYVVRPINPYFTVGGNECELIGDGIGTIELTYTGNPVFEAETHPGLNTTGVVTLGAAFKFTSSGGVFDVEETSGKITLKDGKTSGEQSVTVSYGTYFSRTFTVTVTDTTSAPFEGATISADNKVGQNYLFRVGDDNAFSLDKIFALVEGRTVEDFHIEIYDITAEDGETKNIHIGANPGFTGTITKGATLATSSVKFTGTGIARIDIGEAKKDDEGNIIGFDGTVFPLFVEVVDGKNVASYTDVVNGNCVLLADIEMSSNGSKTISGATLYGNGFTFDIKNGTNASANFGIVQVSNGTLDNVRIIGNTYSTHTNSTGSSHAYSSAAVIFRGTSEIVNSYVYGCRAPIRLDSGNLTVKNTVLEGGRYANVDLHNGHLILDGAVTISNSSLGIVIDASSTGATISGTVKQYNWMCMADDKNLPTDYQSLIGEMFQDERYCHTYDTVYVNTGIVALNEAANTVEVSGYNQFAVSYDAGILGKYTRQLWTLPDSTYDLVEDDPNDLKYRDGANPYPYSRNQGNTKPTYEWTYPEEYDGGKITLSVNKGESVSLNPHFLKATKYSEKLGVSVSMNGTTYTNPEEISFSGTETTTYELVYTITDDVIYDAVGSRVILSEYPTYTKIVTVLVNVVEVDAAPPTFTFYYGTDGKKGGEPYDKQPSNSLTGTVVPIGGVNYVSAIKDGGDSNIDSTTIDGQTVYYPIIDGMIEKGGDNTDFRRYYPIFKAVTISDNGTEYSYSATKEMPTTLVWDSIVEDSGGNSYGSSPVAGTLLFKDKLCRAIGSYGNEESGGALLVKYRYTGADGNEYVYYVKYQYYNEDESCIVEGTMITMADGTQKAVEDLVVGDMIMVFNHITGKYEAMPLIFNTHAGENEAKDRHVLTLEFSNNSNLKIVASHGLFDMTLMKYVYITNENYQDYIGHEFYALNSDGIGGEKVELVNAFVQTEHVRVFCPVTYFHMNSFANGLLNTPNIPGDITGLVNYFEYDADLKYNEEAMQRDIEKYGLYTYEDFSDYISEAAYNSSPAVHLKVAVGKGMITYEQILDVINYLLAGSLID